MKKSDLTELINRKKVLQESLNIVKERYNKIDEIGGYDTPDLMSHYHGNYYDELSKLFFRFDELMNPFGDAISKTIKDDEIKMSHDILNKFISFMESYLKYLQYLKSKGSEINKKYPVTLKPDLGDMDLDNFNLNEGK